MQLQLRFSDSPTASGLCARSTSVHKVFSGVKRPGKSQWTPGMDKKYLFSHVMTQKQAPNWSTVEGNHMDHGEV